MSAAPRQLEIDTSTAAERKREAELEAERQVGLWTDLMAAIRKANINAGGAAEVAPELDAIWGVDGLKRGVSGSTFSAALTGTERNYFRIEWVIWFATHYPEVANILRQIADGKAEIEADEERDNLHEIIREELPRRAAEIIRRAKQPRRKRR